MIAVSLRLPDLQSQSKSSKILNSVTREVKLRLSHSAWNYDTVTCMGGFQSCVLFQGKLEPGDTSRGWCSHAPPHRPCPERGAGTPAGGVPAPLSQHCQALGLTLSPPAGTWDMTLEQHGLQKGKTSSENLFDSSQEAAAPPSSAGQQGGQDTRFFPL